MFHDSLMRNLAKLEYLFRVLFLCYTCRKKRVAMLQQAKWTYSESELSKVTGTFFFSSCAITAGLLKKLPESACPFFLVAVNVLESSARSSAGTTCFVASNNLIISKTWLTSRGNSNESHRLVPVFLGVSWFVVASVC